MPTTATEVLVSQRRSTWAPLNVCAAPDNSGAAPMETTVAVATPANCTAGKYNAEYPAIARTP